MYIILKKKFFVYLLDFEEQLPILKETFLKVYISHKTHYFVKTKSTLNITILNILRSFRHFDVNLKACILFEDHQFVTSNKFIFAGGLSKCATFGGC